jgi:hypothetical protein
LIEETRKYVASRNLAASLFDGETVVLNLSDGNYYGLNPVGSEI